MPQSWVLVSTVASAFEARLLAARLGADGIPCELRGNVDGPYPVGPVHVLVPGDQAEMARQLLLADAVEDVFEAPAFDGAVARRSRPVDLVVLALVLVGVVVFSLVRMLG